MYGGYDRAEGRVSVIACLKERRVQGCSCQEPTYSIARLLREI